MAASPASRGRPAVGSSDASEHGERLSDPDASRVNQAGNANGGGATAADRLSPDARLVAAARTDRAAFGELYDRYVDQIYHYVVRRVGDVELAEDITAAVWEHALAAVGRYEDRGLPFVAWLYRIAGNLVANHYRRARLRRLVPFLGQVSAPDSTLEVDERTMVRDALRELSPADQEVLSLHYYAGLAPEEMAVTLGCSVTVVHKRLQRARERLRLRIGGDRRGPRR